MFGLIIFITQFPSLITQNTLPVWHHHSLVITQYFSHYLWVSYLSLNAVFFSVSPNPVKKKKKKKKKPRLEGRRRSHLVLKEKEKKKKMKKCNPVKKERKKKDGQKLRLKADNGSLHVVLFTEMSLSYKLWKLKITKMCFQFP